jgi:hypothetical protein
LLNGQTCVTRHSVTQVHHVLNSRNE